MDKWLSLAFQFLPMVLANVPHADKVAPYVPLITKAVVAAQETGKPGVDKKSAVMKDLDIAADIANVGPDKVDKALLLETASKGIDLGIDIVKKMHAAHAEPNLIAPAPTT